ncbi:uncharacterized protein [Prorops nasuta]|uniref:uncharacterized protein n=1 Tax=Prorops nasuta TaxID=863751 RepID=UPI0034CF4D27
MGFEHCNKWKRLTSELLVEFYGSSLQYVTAKGIREKIGIDRRIFNAIYDYINEKTNGILDMVIYTKYVNKVCSNRRIKRKLTVTQKSINEETNLRDNEDLNNINRNGSISQGTFCSENPFISAPSTSSTSVPPRTTASLTFPNSVPWSIPSLNAAPSASTSSTLVNNYYHQPHYQEYEAINDFHTGNPTYKNL